jgi:pyruvate/2-oxoglutarate dehydrogenase complex dihydrolipoamide acyltransferase (E2) component
MAWITRNKPFGRPFKPTRFRRLSIGSWGEPSDPTIYGIVEVNAENAIRYIEEWKAKTGEKITVNHFVGKVFAHILKSHRELNSELRWGQFYPRMSVDLSFQVAIENPDVEKNSASENGHDKDGAFHQHDLSAGFVANADQKDISQIAADLNRVAKKIRGSNDSEFAGIKRLSSWVPGVFQTWAVGILRFILSRLNWWSPALGIPKNAFGSVLITNVGSLGIDFALPALFPPASVPMIIAVGALYRAPTFEADAVGNVTRTRLERHIRLCGAFDHRYIDGLHASKIARQIRKYFEHPHLL